MPRAVTAVDLFAGWGGFTEGAERAGLGNAVCPPVAHALLQRVTA